MGRAPRRKTRGQSTRSSVPKPLTSLQLARRQKRLRTLIRKLEAFAGDPDFVAQEAAKIDRLAQIERAGKELAVEFRRLVNNKREETHAAIARIYTAESRQFVDRRSWWQQFWEPVGDFKYFLPLGPETTPFSPTGERSGTSFGCFHQSEATWRKVIELEKSCFSYERELYEARGREFAKLNAEKSTLGAFEYRHKTVSDLPALKGELDECERLLSELEMDEQKLRGLYGVDDRTIAHAAAYTDQTRELADKIKPLLRTQLTRSSKCPYCENEIGETPHADHIFPVSLGGLSTPENMVYVCSDCNLRKQNLTIREFAAKYSREREGIEANLISLGKRI